MAEPQHPIVIRDIDIPFTRLVAFFVKAALAAIPATIIVWLVLAALWLLLAALFGPGPWTPRAW